MTLLSSPVAGLLSTPVGTLPFARRDLAIDLGTANTLVLERGGGVVLREPSVVATERRTGEVEAIGEEAKRMLGRAPASLEVSRPLAGGVIVDLDAAEVMLRILIRRAGGSALRRPRVVVSAPWGMTMTERRALEEAVLCAGASEVHLVEEPLAAAIGAGLPVAEPAASCVLDVGGGASEVAMISLGGIVVGQTVRVAGFAMDEAIQAHLRAEHGLVIGLATAEEVKLAAGCAMPLPEEVRVEVTGRDLATGLPRRVTLSSDEVCAALAEVVRQIADAVVAVLDRSPPELAADVIDRGIVVTGGGALLPGLDARLRQATQVPIHVASDPLSCAARGAAQVLEEVEALEGVRRR